jgi:hypothetical protein
VSNSGETDAVVLGISEKNSVSTLDGKVSEKYVLVQKPESITTMEPMEPLDNDDLWMIPPTDDPSFALLTYQGGDVTISCSFTSPCINTLTAKVFISGANFSCSYTGATNSVTITNNDYSNPGGNSGNNGTTWYDPVTGKTYTVYLYNDYGLVKQVKIDSMGERFTIPMDGYPRGFYYVNIVDEQGNVVTRQTVQVQ